MKYIPNFFLFGLVYHVRLHNMSPIYTKFSLCRHAFPCFPVFFCVFSCFPMFFYVFPWFSLFFRVFVWFPLILPVFPCFSTFSPVSPCFSMFIPVIPCFCTFSRFLARVFLCFSLIRPVFSCYSMFSLILPVVPCFSTFSPVFPLLLRLIHCNILKFQDKPILRTCQKSALQHSLFWRYANFSKIIRTIHTSMTSTF